jgi:enterobactin synthetase component D
VPDALSDALRSLILKIDPAQNLAWGIARWGEGSLIAPEADAVARAVPQRVAEFTAGREAARRAMTALGHAPTAVPAGPDRAPVWPEGLIGSISHSNGLCLAVLGWAAAHHALGVDLEGDQPLDAELIAEICHPEDVSDLLPEARGMQAKRVFSAKEAAYKAHYPKARRMFGFLGLSVDLTKGCARFSDHPEVATIPPESRGDLPVRQVVGGGLILSLCHVPGHEAVT